MSKQFVEKLFNERLLKISNKNIEMRRDLEAQPGQVLFLENLEGFDRALESLGVEKLSSNELAVILDQARIKARKLHTAFYKKNRPRYNKAVRKLQELGVPLTDIGVTVFIVSTFRNSLDAIKADIVDEIKKVTGISEEEGKKLAAMTHKGHGVRGFAVSQVEIASGANFIEKTLKEAGVSNPQQFLENSFASFVKGGTLSGKEYSLIQEIVTNYRQLVTTRGKLRADYISKITYQYGADNLEDSVFEKRLKNIFFKEFAPQVAKDIAQMPGSSSLEQKTLASIIAQFKLTIKPGKNGTLVLRIENSYNPDTTKLKTSGVAKTKGKRSGKAKFTQGKTPTKPRVRVKSGSSLPDIRALIGLLNERLPQQVAKNMESPALNYRTGRFASSVRVTDITSTSKGLPSIGFTYMKNPYQVFEYPGSGNSLAQNPFPGARDPRSLIDKSIREIMAQFIVGRFYTRRQ